MLFSIRHTTRYSYSRPVTFGPVVVRLRPRDDGLQRVRRFELRVTPDPAGRSDCVDLDGSSTTSLWFEGQHDFLSLVTSSDVETSPVNPFAFIVTDEDTAKIPARYPEPLARALATYLARDETSESVDALAALVAEEAGHATSPFLLALCARLAGQIQYAVRDRGDAFPASQTLAEGKGACRDTALLFMEACRAMGLASRFVSGYAEGYVQQGRRDLHAWAEVYLPGGGWRGYDPSMGIAVVDRHVAVSAGSVPALAAPLVGTFVGGAVTTNLWYDISMVMKPA